MRQDLSIGNIQGAGGQWRSIGPKVNTLLVTTYHNVLCQGVYSGLPKGHPVYQDGWKVSQDKTFVNRSISRKKFCDFNARVN